MQNCRGYSDDVIPGRLLFPFRFGTSCAKSFMSVSSRQNVKLTLTKFSEDILTVKRQSTQEYACIEVSVKRS